MTGTRKHYNDGFEGPPLEAGITWFDPASAGSPKGGDAQQAPSRSDNIAVGEADAPNTLSTCNSTTIGERQAIAEGVAVITSAGLTVDVDEGGDATILWPDGRWLDATPSGLITVGQSPSVRPARQYELDRLAATPTTNAPVAAQPIDMLLFCPNCGKQHIDEPEPFEATIGIDTTSRPDWTNPPHRSHLCHDCGCIWRPADVATNGVATIATLGKADTWSDIWSAPAALRQTLPIHGEMREALERIDQFVTNFRQPWGSWKTVWWEGEVSDEAAFSADNALMHVANIARNALPSNTGSSS